MKIKAFRSLLLSVVAAASACAAQPGKYTDGGQPLKAQPWASEVGAKWVADGQTIDFDSGDQCQEVLRKNYRGTALPITRKNAPGKSPQLLTIEPMLQSVYRGVWITAGAPDCILLNPRIAGTRDEGIWAEGSNCQIIGGHIYGCGCGVRFGGGAASEGGLASGTTMSDAIVCCDILRPNVSIVGCFSQTGFSKNFHVAGQGTTISATRITTGRVQSEYPDPIGIALEAWPKANCTRIGGVKMYVQPGATGIVGRSQGVSIDCRLECGANATAFRMAEPMADAHLVLWVTSNDPSAPAIVDLSAGLGWTTTVEVYTLGTKTIVRQPSDSAHWPANSDIIIDHVVQPHPEAVK